MSRNTYSSALTPTNIMHLYFFKSTCDKDSISNLTILTSNRIKEFVLAHRYFAKHNYKGEPAMLAI